MSQQLEQAKELFVSLFGFLFFGQATVPSASILRSLSSLHTPHQSRGMATTLAAAAARRLAAPRLSIQAATLTQRRCLAGSAGIFVCRFISRHFVCISRMTLLRS